MEAHNTAISLGIGAATAAGLSLLNVNKDFVIGSTAVVMGAGLMIALNKKNNLNIKVRDYEYFLIEQKTNLNLQTMKRQYSTTTKH